MKEMDVLMSIRLKHANRIFDGSKKNEYRTRIPSKPFDKVWVYVPELKGIIGWFRVKDLIPWYKHELEDLILPGGAGGPWAEEALNYLGEREKVWIMVIKYKSRCWSSFGPVCSIDELTRDRYEHVKRPPQSWQYLRRF